MKYLSYEGLQYLAEQIKEYIESKVFKRNFESTSSEAKSASGDGVTYFTSDTKQIIKDGVAYGGSIATTQSGTASDQITIKTVTEDSIVFYPKTHIDAVIGLDDFASDMSDYATKQWVEDKNLVIAQALNLFHNNQSWQNE